MTNVIHVQYEATGESQKFDNYGMRDMQQRAFAKRDDQYILIKAPPASGKSRALMYLGLHKLMSKQLKKVLVAVPEKSIGNSFKKTDLTTGGFPVDWNLKPDLNLCTDENTPDAGLVLKSKVQTVGRFLKSNEELLVCTHATLRSSFDQFPIEDFDDCLIAVDEFHHAAAADESKLGEVVRGLIARGKAHIVAMTGSYFRGDAVLVMQPEDEARFSSVTYTYYEQLNGYKHLKSLGIGYHFYSDKYTDSIGEVLDTTKKTIIHIPHVGSAAHTGDKYTEVLSIFSVIGEYQKHDSITGLHHIKTADGRILKVADLVEDTPEERMKVQATLRKLENRDAVDIIIALGMAKEGFDWPWCEHALTVGYRSSLTEIIQIIGRATRDAPNKVHAQFTNLIPEPEATEGTVVEAVNDLLKAISASLLMQQVLAPKFKFIPKKPKGEDDESDPSGGVTQNPDTGEIIIEVKNLPEVKSPKVQQLLDEKMTEIIQAICTDPVVALHATANPDLTPQTLNQVLVPKVIEERCPDLDDEELEELRFQVVARMNVLHAVQQQGQDGLPFNVPDDPDPVKLMGGSTAGPRHPPGTKGETSGTGDPEKTSTAAEAGLLKLVKRFINVRELDIDLIDSINPFQSAYEIISKDLDTKTLAQINTALTGRTIPITEDEAKKAWPRIVKFKEDNNRYPSALAANEVEKRLGEIFAWLMNKKKEAAKKQQ
ncbi:MAG: DEAD/DEAH box helicase [Rhodobacteraceae bacterium]|nr:DEAD/DEAH box helicase [Paracoccaceae bacterium]MCZ8083049.1 DEAD/DEAH box helicase [Paracoccaceae bacterium]